MSSYPTEGPAHWTCAENANLTLNTCDAPEEDYSDDDDDDEEEAEPEPNGIFLSSIPVSQDAIIDNRKFLFTNKVWDTLGSPGQPR